MITAADLDPRVFVACPVSAAVAEQAGPQRQPIPGLAAARAAGVKHEQLAEVMTHAVRRVCGTIPAWWALTAMQDAEPGRRWPLETLLIDDELVAPLGDIARGWTNVVNCPLPWEKLSTVLSVPGTFAYVGSQRFAEIEEIDCGYNIVINGGTGCPQDPMSGSVGHRYDPTMTLSDRVTGALTDAALYAEYHGFKFTAATKPGQRTIPRCSWTDICGYRTGANLLDIKIGSATLGVSSVQKFRQPAYNLLHA